MEALRRGQAYAAAGADMILVHSKQNTPDEILSFVAKWPLPTPIAVVPTAYPDLTEALIRATGKIRLVIYGNHAIRAAVTGMRRVFAQIRAEGGIAGADKAIVSVDEIFELQRVGEMKANEKRYLR